MSNEDLLLGRLRTLVLLAPIAIILGLFVLTYWAWLPKEQPIAFSHKLHAGTREVDCKYCHRGVEKGTHAGVPSVTECWNCHQGLVKNGSFNSPVIDRPEIKKLLTEYVEKQQDIKWFKNYDLPEHVHFSHKSHINAGKKCEDCHGDVKNQEVVQMVNRPHMGWCVDCHRKNNAPVDCTTCHY